MNASPLLAECRLRVVSVGNARQTTKGKLVSPVAKMGKRPRKWMVIVGAVIALAATGGVAVAQDGPSAGGPARDARSSGTTAKSPTAKSPAAKVARTPKPKGKPHPSPTPTTSPTRTPTATPTPSPSDGSDVKIPMPGYTHFRFGDILVDEARNRVYITGGDGTENLVVTDLDGGNLRTIRIGMGAAGMTLSPDGAKL